nr:MAG: RNA-dependent RNA polymerase [Sanya bunya-like virus 18]
MHFIYSYSSARKEDKLLNAIPEMEKWKSVPGCIFETKSVDRKTATEFSSSVHLSLDRFVLAVEYDAAKGVVRYVISASDGADELSQSVNSVINGELVLEYVAENAYKVPHDLVCMYLSGRRENEFDMKSAGLGESDIPDCFLIRNGYLEVLEVKTCNDNLLKTRLQEAFSQHQTEPWVAVCSEVHVATNLSLSQLEVNTLCFLVTLGRSLYKKAEDEKIIEASPERKLLHKNILDSISKIPLSSIDDPLCVKPDELSPFCTLEDGRNVDRLVEQIKRESVKEYNSPKPLVTGTQCYDHFERMEKDGMSVKSNRRVVKAPFLSVNFLSGLQPAVLPTRTEDGPMQMLLESVLEHFTTNENMASLVPKSPLEEGSLEVPKRKTLIKDSDQSTKHKYTFKLTQEDAEALAERGFEGRRFKNLTSKKIKEEESSKFQSIRSKTSDILHFIKDLSLYSMTSSEKLLSNDFTWLIEKAEGMSIGDHSSFLNQLGDFSRTRIGSYTFLLSLIASEINLSMRTDVKRGQVLFKKVPGFPLYLILKPTTSSGHCSASIVVDKRDGWCSLDYPGDIFTPFLKYADGVYVSEFFSVTSAKMENLLHCFEISCLIKSAWKDICRKEDEATLEIALMNTLVLLEDKNGTSTALQQIRYAYNAVINPYPLDGGPLKVYKKFSRPRTRLEVFVLRSCFNNFPRMVGRINTKPEMDEEQVKGKEERSQENFPGLINVFTCTHLLNFSIVLNIAYICQFKNKEGMSLIHSERRILVKILKHEMTLRDLDYENLGNPKNLQDCKNHQYSSSLVRYSSSLMKDFLIRTKGISDYDDFMTDSIVEKLSEQTLEKIATFKSSAVVQKETYKGEKSTRRTKVIEASMGVRPLLVDSSSVFTKIDAIHSQHIRKSGPHIRADVFRKQQIGSDREIFILTVESRILVLLVETISRTLCEMIPWEMLTSGTQKIRKIQDHRRRELSAQSHNTDSYIVRSYCSNDASQWAQGFIMKMFADMLGVLVPKRFHSAVCEVLNLVTNKRLRVPDGLLEEFKSGKDDNYMAPELNELKKQFLMANTSGVRDDLINLDSRYMKNRSNMMQGILHYTSSLYHACKMMFDISLFRSLQSSYGLQKTSLIVTGCVSSDDSSIAKAMVCDKKQVRKAQAFLRLCSIAVAHTCTGFGITLSREKSTRDVHCGIIEFNSFWTVRNTIMSPKIKYIYPSVLPATIRGMEDKLHQYSNIRQQLLENGFHSDTISLAQICQAHVHYRTMGMYTHPDFGSYCSKIVDSPLSPLGFFLLEPEGIVGLFGLEYAQYTACIKSPTYVKADYSVTKMSTDCSMTGRPTLKWSLTIGDDSQHRKMMSRFQVKPSEARAMLQDPGSLLRRSETPEESTYKIVSKAFKPTSAESFSFNNASKAHVVSVFCLTHQCVTTRVMEDSNTEKHSLLHCVKTVSDMAQTVPMFDKQSFLHNCFPSYEIYDMANAELETRLRSDRVTKIRSSHSLTYNVVKSHFAKSLFSTYSRLKESLLTLWYDRRLVSDQTAEYVINCYSTLIPWLDIDKSKSLEASPFDNELDMVDHLSKVAPRNKTIAAMIPGRCKPGVMNIVSTLLRTARTPGVVYDYITAGSVYRTGSAENKELSVLTQKIMAIGSSCLSDQRKEEEILSEISSTSLSFVPRAEPLIAMSEIMKAKDLEPDRNLFHVLDNSKRKSYSVWKKSQTHEVSRRRWTGEGVVIVVFNELRARIKVYNETIELVEVNSIRSLEDNEEGFCKLLRETLRDDFISGTHGEAYIYLDVRSLHLTHSATRRGTTPIRVADLRDEFVRIGDLRFGLAFSHGSVKLEMHQSWNKVGKQTISEYRFRDPESKMVTLEGQPKRLEEFWILNQELPYQRACQILTAIGAFDKSRAKVIGYGSAINERNKETVAVMIDWIKETFNRRLNSLINKPTNLAQVEIKVEELMDTFPEDDIDKTPVTMSTNAMDALAAFGDFNIDDLFANMDFDAMEEDESDESSSGFESDSTQEAMHELDIYLAMYQTEEYTIDRRWSPVEHYMNVCCMWDDCIRQLDSKCGDMIRSNRRYSGKDNHLRILDSLRAIVDEENEDKSMVYGEIDYEI